MNNYKPNLLMVFKVPTERRPWMWICRYEGKYCSEGAPKDNTWDTTFTAAKCHAHGKHRVVI